MFEENKQDIKDPLLNKHFNNKNETNHNENDIINQGIF